MADRDNGRGYYEPEGPKADDTPTPSTLPEVYYYPGIEPVSPVGHSEDKQFVAISKSLPPNAPSQQAAPGAPFWKRRRWIFGILALVIIILAAVLIPVGLLVLKSDGDSDSDGNSDGNGDSNGDNPSTPAPSATSSPTANSDDAILQDTRLETMGSRSGDFFLYYQAGDGGLHFIPQSRKREWQGSTDLKVTDAKLGTPLASTSAEIDGTVFWWLFYVDKSNIIRNIYSKADLNDWHKGTVDSQKYKVSNQSSIAFTVRRGIEYDDEKKFVGGGISLYATDTDGVIREYIYDDDDESWSEGFSFDEADGYSGATTWGVFSSAYFFTRSKDRPEMQVWWRDYKEKNDDSNDDDSEDSDNSNRNTWHLGSVSNAPMMQGGGMWGGFAFAFQAPDGTIRGHKVTRSDSDPSATRWGEAYDISESDEPAVNGTGLSGFYFFPSPDPDAELSTMFHMFYQVADTYEIVEAVRDWAPDNKTVPGVWRYNTVPIN